MNPTSPAAGQAYLRIENLRVDYGRTTAVDGVSLSIEAGRTLCLLGPSGCGKTTILRTVAGLIEPTSGSVVLDGADLVPIPIHRRDIGMVFQTWALFPHMTVEQNVAYGLRMRKVAKSERTQRVREALELVRLENFGSRRPSELSGGQQQRVALARAVVTRPRVLLLDEPLSSLDLKIRTELRRELRRIQRTLGVTAVYVTHDHSEAVALGDEVAVMAVGKVVEIGPPEQLFSSPRTRYVTDFLGFDNILPATEVSTSGSVVKMRIANGEQVPAQRGDPGPDGDSYSSIAISPWAVTPRRADIGASGRVVSLDQQSGRLLVSIELDQLGVVNGFAPSDGEPPHIGERVAVDIDWTRSRALAD